MNQQLTMNQLELACSIWDALTLFALVQQSRYILPRQCLIPRVQMKIKNKHSWLVLIATKIMPHR
jgi:hypothetical protein